MSNVCQYCSVDTCSGQEQLIAHNTMFGPTLDEVLLSLVMMLPTQLLEAFGIIHKSNVKEHSHTAGDLNTWLSKEVRNLAVELSLLGYDITEPGICHPTPSMLQARKFVLNKLAELMEKKDETEQCTNTSK